LVAFLVAFLVVFSVTFLVAFSVTFLVAFLANLGGAGFAALPSCARVPG